MRHFTAAALGMLLAWTAQCAPFADPTRPPLAAEQSTLSSGSPGGPRLESILIAPDRRIAVINGQPVTLGARIGAGEVVRITESEVVIRGAERVETLKLFPEFAKRPPSPPEKRTPK